MAHYTSSVMLDPVVMDNNMYFDDFDRTIFDDDDDDVLRSSRGGRTDLRAHLDDLARRHPEFADHLRSPPGWVSDFQSGSSSGGYSGSGGVSGEGGGSYYQEAPSDRSGSPSNHNVGQQSSPVGSQQEAKGSAADRRRDNLAQHGLRNTDPEIGLKGKAAAKEDRNQRSMSAPPDNRSQSINSDKPHRFVSKIEINPVNPVTGETAASMNSADTGTGKPPMAPPKPQQQSQTSSQPQQAKQTVRHIPIYVEGRDEPVLPKNIDQDFNVPLSNTSRPQFHSQHQQQSFAPNASNSSSQSHFNAQSTPPPPPPPPTPQQQAHTPQRKQTQPPHYEQPKQQESKVNEQNPQSAEKKQKINNDPIFQVQQIQNDVDQLRKCVMDFKGTSRSDKEYVYLDEMLTRNLIKLDNIETDGKENVRATRKEAIKSIQQCISILESKVPQTPMASSALSISDNMDIDASQNNSAHASQSSEAEGKQSDAVNKSETEPSTDSNKMEGEGSAMSIDQSNSTNSSTEVNC